MSNKTIKIEDIIKKITKLLTKTVNNRFLLYKIAGLVVVIAVVGFGIWFFMNKDNTEEAQASFVATGGTVTDVDGYRIHTFTSTDTFTVMGGGGAVEVLVVAGGGGGGETVGGGGGGGGVIYEKNHALTAKAYTITVGTGGTGDSGNCSYTTSGGTAGLNSSFDNLLAIGGGGGGAYNNTSNAATTGGSGGGIGAGNASSAMAGTTGQGYAGGISSANGNDGAGGGGASKVGTNGINGTAGIGGDGVSYSISGSAVYYGGGGGGGARDPGGTAGGAGGLGGGGAGGYGSVAGTAGTANTGGGGGGGGYKNTGAVCAAGGNGGSGIVIIRYPLSIVGPVAYWSFDEGYASTTYDRIGNNHGTIISNTQWVDGRFGKALSFDGVDDHVDAGDVILTTSNTFMYWVKKSDYNVNPTDWAIEKYGDYDSYINSNNVECRYYGLSDTSVRANNALSNNGDWYHVTCRYDGSSICVFVNGIEKDCDVSTGTITTTSNNLFLGGNHNSGFSLDGLIDEVKIFNRALTYKEVATEYASGGGTGGGASLSVGKSFNRGKSGDPGTVTDGLVGYWKMDEASWNGTAGEVIDYSGMGNHGTSTNATSTTDQAKFGRSGGFDGSGDYVDIASSTSWNFGTGDFAVGMWIYTTANQNDKDILDFGSDHLTEKRIMFWSSKMYFYDNDEVACSIFDPDVHPLNEWVYYIFTRNGSTLSLYNNATLKAQKTSCSSEISAYNSLKIGARNDSGTFFNGYIDDVKIYNRALSSNEVMREYVSGPGPVGYWRFEEQTGTTANDVSGNFNTGTLINGPVWNAAGAVGGALRFDGVDDYIDMGDQSALEQPVNVTISAWVKPSTLSDNSIIIWNSGAYGIAYSYTSAGAPADQFAFSIYDGSWNEAANTSKVNAGVWYYLTGTYDGSYIKIYVDGVLENSVADSTTISNGTNFGVGAYSGGDGFNAVIDEVKIYNYARSQRQIMQDYNGGGPVGYWKFDEGYASTTYDGSGQGNNGTLTDNSLWTDFGKFGKALNFDGVNDYISIADNNSAKVATQSSLTISAWFKTTKNDSTYQRIVSKQDSSDSSYYFVRVYNGQAAFGIADNYGSGDHIISITSGNLGINDGQWHQIIGVFDRSVYTGYLYIDGRLIDSDTKTALTGTVNGGTEPLTIGGLYIDSALSENLQGLIDEIKIYNYARTAEEVRQDYYVAKGGPTGKTASIGIGDTRKQGKEYTTGSNGLVGYWKFDETSAWGSTVGAVKDSSGMGNHGTSTSATYATSTTDQAKYGRSAGFNGNAGAYIDIAGSSAFNFGIGDFTWGFWAYHRGAQTNGEPIIDHRGSAWGSGDYMIYFGPSNIYIMYNNGSDNWSGFASIAINTWTYITVVRNGGYIKFYSNGSLISQYDVVTGNSFGSSEFLTIGGHSTLSTIGYLDDVKAFNRALSPDEIMREYVSGPGPVGYWRFEEQTGTTANDVSGNFNTGTLTNGPSWQANGAVGGALRFDGSDDYVQLSNLGAFRPPAATVSAWVKRSSAISSGKFIYSKTANCNAYVDEIELGVTGNNTMRCGYGDNTTSARSTVDYTNTANIMPNTSAWTQIVCTAGDGYVKAYANGMLGNSASLVALGYNTDNSASPIVAKAECGATDYFFPGFIDEVRFYDYVRTQRQVAYDYNGGKPLAHWKFDEGSGGTAYDASGNGNNGTIYPGTGGVTATSSMWVTNGKINSALSFDGTDDCVTIDDSTLWDFDTNDFTVETWFYRNDLAQDAQLIGQHDGGVGAAFIIFARVSGYTGINVYFVTQGGGTGDLGFTYPITIGRWYHLVVKRANGSDVSVYIDGVLIGTQTYSGEINNATQPLTFGADTGGNANKLNGKMDDIRIYNYARTPEEVRLDYNNGAGVRF